MITYKQIENIIHKKHKSCSWYEKFIYTDCSIQIIEEILELIKKDKSK